MSSVDLYPPRCQRPTTAVLTFWRMINMIKLWTYTDEVRSESGGKNASIYAKIPAVRKALLHRQQAMRTAPGLVADGRDMGTVVFPDAFLKVFLEASAAVRAQRRHKQLSGKGFDVKLRALELKPCGVCCYHGFPFRPVPLSGWIWSFLKTGFRPLTLASP